LFKNISNQFPWIFGLEVNKNPKKGASVTWKSILNSFLIIENGIAWKIGNGHWFKVGKYPWLGSGGKHILSKQLIRNLHTLGIAHLNNLADPRHSTLWSHVWMDVNNIGLGEEETL